MTRTLNHRRRFDRWGVGTRFWTGHWFTQHVINSERWRRHFRWCWCWWCRRNTGKEYFFQKRSSRGFLRGYLRTELLLLLVGLFRIRCKRWWWTSVRRCRIFDGRRMTMNTSWTIWIGFFALRRKIHGEIDHWMRIRWRRTPYRWIGARRRSHWFRHSPSRIRWRRLRCWLFRDLRNWRWSNRSINLHYTDLTDGPVCRQRPRVGLFRNIGCHACCHLQGLCMLRNRWWW